eukprot:gene3205-26558_t
MTGNEKAADILLEHGADPLERDDVGDYPFEWAMRHGHGHLSRKMLKEAQQEAQK